jgi:TonB family protein
MILAPRIRSLTRLRLTLSIVVAAVVLSSRIAGAAPAVVAPQRIGKEAVPYPAGGTGDAFVVLALVVDAEGVVTGVTVQEGAPPFADAAMAAVKTWRFRPATRDETPIASRILATVTFHAPVSPSPPHSVAAPPASVPARAPASGTPVEVSVRGEHEELGTIHIPRSETRFIPGAFGDPFRVVEALPGMTPWLSGLPYYYVRGSPPENVGYFIDGIRVPLLFHVGAGPSMISPPLVDSVDLFPGAYPAQYGRYAGAIIAGTTTPPETTRTRAEFGVRVFDANAFGEVPYDSGRGSVMGAARYGYTGLITSLFAPNYTVGYWDYQARASHLTWGSDTVSLFVFGAHDELTYQKAPTFRVEYHRADLRYDHPLQDGSLRIAATFSTDDTLTALQTPTGAGASAALQGPGGHLRAELEERMTSEMRVRAGADVGVARFDVDNYDGVIHAPHTDVEGGVYSDVVWRPSARVELVPGLRLDAYQARGESGLAPQPRLATKIRIAPAVSWISALGVAHQEPTEEVFVPAKLPNPIDEAGGGNSYQGSEGVEVRLPSSMRVRATAFYSELVATSLNGTERALGGELFLRRDFTERLGGFVSYTLSRTDTT